MKNVLYNYHMPMKKERKQKKLNYRKPELLRYGFVRDLTLAGSAGNPEGGSGKPDKKVGFSDRRLKENILEVGRHPSGIALYLFDFKIQYRDMCGDGRQFGVMADEVETTMPNAVSLSSSGFKMVDYHLLGIERHTH